MDLKDITALLAAEQVETRLEGVRALAQEKLFYPGEFVTALGDADWRVRKEAITLYLNHPAARPQTPLVIEQLRHPENAGLRNAAIEILISLGGQGTDELIAQLAVSSAEVRKFIVDILGEIGQPAVVKDLLPYLQDDDENVRYAVVETCGKLHAVDAVDELLKLLESADAGLRFTIFDALSTLGAGVPVDKILPYASDRLLRKTVFSCLGKIGDAKALPVLLEGLADPLKKAREAALLALGDILMQQPDSFSAAAVTGQFDNLSELAVPYLEHENDALRIAACYVLTLQPTEANIGKMLPLLIDEGLRDAAVAACRRCPPELFERLIATHGLNDEISLYLIFLAGELKLNSIESLALEALASENPQLRYAATLTLGSIFSVKAAAGLSELLQDEIPDIRAAASAALQKIGTTAADEVIRAVAPCLESDQTGLRLLAVRTLRAMPFDQVEDYLVRGLKDVAPEVRCEALRDLGGNDSPRLLSVLSLALTDENGDVRRLAAAALGDYPLTQVFPILENALNDDDPWVRTAVIRSLQAGSDEEILVLLQKAMNDPVGVVVIAALEIGTRLLGDKMTEQLQSSLSHQDSEVVKTAVALLISAGHQEQLLASDDPRIRLAAAQELQRREPEVWLNLFARHLDQERDTKVRTTMEEALRRGRAED